MGAADGKRRVAALALMALLAATPATARADGNAAAGAALAGQWCQSCHAIGPGAKTTSDAAPSFQEIALHPRTKEGGLRAWLFAPHPPMPNLNLSQRQIDDLTAYILSLAPQ